MAGFNIGINQRLTALEACGVILFFTDTIWGNDCDAINDEIVYKKLSIKYI